MDMYKSNLHNDTYKSQFTILEKQIDILTTMNGNQDVLIMKLADELIETKRKVRVSSFLTGIATALSIVTILVCIVCR